MSTTRFAPPHRHRVRVGARHVAVLVVMVVVVWCITGLWAASEQALPPALRVLVALVLNVAALVWGLVLARQSADGWLVYQQGQFTWLSGANPSQAATQVRVHAALDLQHALLLGVRGQREGAGGPLDATDARPQPHPSVPRHGIWLFAADASQADWLALRRCVADPAARATDVVGQRPLA
jgi:hypothetical protein